MDIGGRSQNLSQTWYQFSDKFILSLPLIPLSGSFNKTIVTFQFHLPCVQDDLSFKMIMNTSLIFPLQQSNLISLLFYIYANFQLEICLRGDPSLSQYQVNIQQHSDIFPHPASFPIEGKNNWMLGSLHIGGIQTKALKYFVEASNIVSQYQIPAKQQAFSKKAYIVHVKLKIRVNTSVEWLLEMAPNNWWFSWWVFKIYKHNSQKKLPSFSL